MYLKGLFAIRVTVPLNEGQCKPFLHYGEGWSVTSPVNLHHLQLMGSRKEAV